MTAKLSFGQWLQQRRRALDLTQEMLAERVDYSVDTIRKIERGARRPSRQIAERLAQALQVPDDDWDRFIHLARLEGGDDRARQVSVLPPMAQPARTNLPTPLTGLVGRARELNEALALVSTQRLVTLTGVGGVGKTRLAIQVARELGETFIHGVWLVELAPLADAALVPKAVAAALAVPEEPSEPLLTTLVRSLGEKHVLVLLDNCEHLIDTCAQLAESLLQTCPRLHILATSREVLSVAGEHIYPVPPLAVPAQGDAPSSGRLHQYGAVQLFLARAAAVQPNFTLTPDNAAVVAEICTRLDGLPLALELAAARIRLFPVAHIAAHLDQRFRLLNGGSRTAQPRHQTLRALIDWSYDLLSPAEQTLFRRLAIFAGGWTLEAAEAVCSAAACTPLPSLDGIASLVDKSLVRRVTGIDDEPRFEMLETIRAYGLERLETSEEASAVRRWHAAFFLTLAETAEQEREGPKQRAWLERLEREHDNLRAALHWSLAQDREMGLRLAGALWWFWQVRGHFEEGRRWLEEALAQPGPAVWRARALTGAGTLAWCQGEYAQASAFHNAALSLYREIGNDRGVAFALNNLGVQALSQNDYARATALYTESLAGYRALGDQKSIALVLNNLGVVAQYQGNYRRAAALYEESLALARELGDKQRIASRLFNLGEVASLQGQYAQAADLYQESLQLWQELESKGGIARCLAGLGGVAIMQGELASGTRLCSAAQTLLDTLGHPLDPAERTHFERTVATARTKLGKADFETHWKTGENIPLAQAIEEALKLSMPVAHTKPAH